ncbi:FAD-dependent oxidoreductase [Bifidobacterium choloepi]|uniref:NAD(P)-binding protein n=1 Tax=Bifidobacterium choloepi TaxID=2614131 RepID=A0A6I5MY91_9BIFI|nr:FAD-dependent oxidoreductase [Bifidobacterium choloepi]NEG69156.1 NAD(P)-binding protein [Bifidobacterium choloepi]
MTDSTVAANDSSAIAADDVYDVVVVGGGPAGLTAGMYLGRARYRVLVLEKEEFGGRITATAEVVNYPGVASTDGAKLTAVMRGQARDFGAELKVADVTGITLDDSSGLKTVRTSAGDFRCFGIVLATGAAPRPAGFDGEREYAGRGVAYCATCDGEFYSGKEVLVVGGGYAAAEEAVFLARYASHVTVVVREPDFTCAASAAERTKNDPKVSVLYNTRVVSVSGGRGGLTEAVLHDDRTGETTVFKPADGGTFGVFVFAGTAPQTAFVKDIVELDAQGYVVTDAELKTSVDGIYAAGDIRIKPLRQVVTAAADGALAATELERYCSTMSRKTGIVPRRPTASAYRKREEPDGLPARTSPAPATARPSDDAAAARISSEAKAAAANGGVDGAFFDEATRRQLDVVFAKMANPVTLELTLDRSMVSVTLANFVDELASLSGGKIAVRRREAKDVDPSTGRADIDPTVPLPQATPMVRIMTLDMQGELEPTTLAFHGVPTGHEFNSFVLGIYNAAGPGQPISDDERARIDAIGTQVDIMILVSLSCTMCPETVRAAQRIAALNPNVRAEAYDLAHFPKLKQLYEVMSVPCIVVTKHTADGDVDGQPVIDFGRKSVSQMLQLIGA